MVLIVEQHVGVTTIVVVIAIAIAAAARFVGIVIATHRSRSMLGYSGWRREWRRQLHSSQWEWMASHVGWYGLAAERVVVVVEGLSECVKDEKEPCL